MAATLSGCVAVAVPVVAGGALGAKTVLGRKRSEPATRTSIPAPVEAASADRAVTYLPAGSVLPPPTGTIEPVEPASVPPAVIDPWNSLVRYVAARILDRPSGSVVMVAGSSIAAPRWVACADKPLAAIVDVEMMGTAAARTALDAVRTMGVGIVPMGGRPIPGVQRSAVAAKYCVIAIMGDQPGDFSDQLRDGGTVWADTTAPVARLKDAGWFLAPSPTDGSVKITEGAPD